MQRIPARSSTSTALADRIRSILAGCGLSLSQISRASRSRFPANPLHHIPHNFYSSLRNRGFSPSLYQLLTLSILSEYRLVDWLALFGFCLDDIPRFQVLFPALHTVELDTRVYHPGTEIPWFLDLQEPDFSAPLTPLSQWLTPTVPQRFASLSSGTTAKFRYFKIGSRDAFAFPELLPGSVVRANSRLDEFQRMPIGKTPSKSLWLVEHSSGLICSRLCRTGPRKAVLSSRHLPYAPVELQLETDASLLGIADVEIRPTRKIETPVVPATLGRFWTPAPFRSVPRATNVGEFIRRARERCGLSFREASARTQLIAKKLDDSRYYCAAGSLSDYEARQIAPRHIHKLLSICSVYVTSAAALFEACGIPLDDAGKRSMPPELLEIPPSVAAPASRSSYFLAEMERRFKGLPLFLRDAVPDLFGMPDVSVRDVFWAGGIVKFAHPYLAGALLLLVDRKHKTPRLSLSSPTWAQPLYVLQRRDGTYLCGVCSLQNSTLILRSGMAGTPRLLRLRNRLDAEVIGKITGIVRRLA